MAIVFFAPLFRIDRALFSHEYLIAQAKRGPLLHSDTVLTVLPHCEGDRGVSSNYGSFIFLAYEAKFRPLQNSQRHQQNP